VLGLSSTDCLLSNMDSPWITQFYVTLFQIYTVLRKKRNERMTFFKWAPSFYMWEWKSNEMKVSGEECCAIPQAVGQLCCSGCVPVYWSSDFNQTPQWICVYLTICLLDMYLRKIWFVLDLPECNYRVSWGEPVCCTLFAVIQQYKTA